MSAIITRHLNLSRVHFSGPGRRLNPLKWIWKRCLLSSSRLDVEISDDQTTAWVKMPGYAYDDVDRTGSIPIWKIARLSEGGRMRLFNNLEGVPEWTRKLGENRILFMKSSHHTIHPAMYTGNWLYAPLISVVRLGDLGRTSLVFVQELRSADSPDIVLNNNTIRAVVGDPVTRRGLPVVPEVRKVFDDRKVLDPVIEFIHPALETHHERPRDAQLIRQVANPSDMDEYQHMNQCHFLRYSHDAASLLTSSGVLRDLSGDLSHYKVKQMDSVYTGEWNASEIADIHVWQDPNNAMVLYFEIEKESRTLFNARMELYSSEELKLPDGKNLTG